MSKPTTTKAETREQQLEERKQLAADVETARTNAETKRAILEQQRRILAAAQLPAAPRSQRREAVPDTRNHPKEKKLQDLEEKVVDAELIAAAAATYLAATVMREARGLRLQALGLADRRRKNKIWGGKMKNVDDAFSTRLRKEGKTKWVITMKISMLESRLNFAEQVRSNAQKFADDGLAEEGDIVILNAAKKYCEKLNNELALWNGLLKESEGGDKKLEQKGGNTRKYKHHRRLAKRRRRTKRRKRRRRTKRRKRRRRTERRKRLRRTKRKKRRRRR